MKATLELRQRQQMALTPQLAQSIRLLTLSALELRSELRQLAERNVMLDVEEPAGAEPEPERSETEVETDWEAAAVETADPWAAAAPEPRELAPRGGPGLHEHLQWQLSISRFTDTDRAIAATLVDALDDDGYLTESLDEIRRSLEPELECSVQAIEAVLHRIQALDPPGVAARNLSECLVIQLRQLPDDLPSRDLALRVADGYLERLAGGRMPALADRLAVTPRALEQAADLIRSLNPRPGSALPGDPVETVIPDILVSHRGGRWRVELNSDTVPRVELNHRYAESLKHTGARHQALNDQLAEARSVLKALEIRRHNMLAIGEAIVRRQQAFLEQGPEALRPMTLRDIAEATDLHESTVSRLTTRKYMHTPRGVFELKYFFPSQVGTGDTSGTAIQSIIRRLVSAENPAKPLSDSRIVRELSSQGLTVARRTVAKYRDVLGIPPSHERKQA